MSQKIRSPIRSGQAGIALVVALIFLVILTLLGIAALGNNTLQTRMAYGASETNLAFQSAETALSAGENWLYAQPSQPSTGCATTNATSPVTYTPIGNCGQSADSAAYIWPRPQPGSGAVPPVNRNQFFDDTWWTANGRKYGYIYTDGVTPVADGNQPFSTAAVNETPRYVIEELGPDITGSLVQGQGPTYRIYNYQVTARSYGVQSSTRTVVQSTFGQGY